MKQYKPIYLVLHRILRTTLLYAISIINPKSIIGIFYPLGEPILPHLLRYSTFVVKDHNFMCCALHLRQPRLVNNPGYPELFINIIQVNLNFWELE